MRIFESIGEVRAAVGGEAAVSPWLTVDQRRIDLFAEASEDRQWIHVDAERAGRESRFGGTIAHGFLTLGLISQLSREAFQIRGDYRMRINYGVNRVRFPAPVPAGARVRAHFTPASVKDIEGGVEIAWHVVMELEGSSRPAMDAEWLFRLYA
jgi:acyl dehydratase